MKGVRKAHLELEVAEINAILEYRNSNKELRLGGAYGRSVIELLLDGQMEKLLSPFLPKPQLYDWLCAFRLGLCFTPEPRKPRQWERGEQDPELFFDKINKALEILGAKELVALDRINSTMVEQILSRATPELIELEAITDEQKEKLGKCVIKSLKSLGVT